MKVRLRWIPTGQLLCREGDPPGPLYLICAGLMRVYRRDPERAHREIELARVATGDIIGELAPILDQPRSASVQALEPTQVLEMDAREIGALMQHQAPLRRVVGLALQERSGLAPEAVAALAAKLGISLAATATAERAITLPEPAHETALVYTKAIQCPACGTSFSALAVRPKKDMPGERSTDFHQSYRSKLNPYNYELWVCPNDLYAAFPADFAELSRRQSMQVAAVVDGVVQGWGGMRPDFNTDRTLELREQALELALPLYRMRQAPPLRLAAILHRLAWCARERGDRAAERRRLAQALDAYTTGYRETHLDPREELRVLYLCGELCLRLGATNDALQWFGQGLRHSVLKEHPAWERALRDRWARARELAATSGESEQDAA